MGYVYGFLVVWNGFSTFCFIYIYIELCIYIYVVFQIRWHIMGCYLQVL